ncbi:MAG: FtsW/RodA/SpoVE family cell cycle protein [Sedimentisphaerales bacterium]|nr:FtsW/RodA/SpoVE family cell cycle protein [Sedimentisphaerales bacterium]
MSYLIEAVVLLLMATGTVFVFSAGANVKTTYDFRHFYAFTTLRNIALFPLAVLVMYMVARMDYRRLGFLRSGAMKSWTLYLLALAIVLLILTLVIGQGIGPERQFARRWLRLPLGSANISFQPSELAKWTVIFFLAAFMDRKADSMKSLFRGFFPACAVIGLVVLLIITQDFGTAAFIGLVAFLLLAMGGVRWWHLLGPVLAAIPFGVLLWATAPNVLLNETRVNRIEGYLARFWPDLYPGVTAGAQNYQADQSLVAISTGGLWGTGLGKGILKYGHLPEDTSDFIFAVICEEMGFVGGIFVILLFVTFVILGFVVVFRCRDRLGKLLAGGIVTAIGLQAAINIGVVTVVLPTKGIPLPFISAGGTSMLVTAAAVGVLLNVARHGNAETDLTLRFCEETPIVPRNLYGSVRGAGA